MRHKFIFLIYSHTVYTKLGIRHNLSINLGLLGILVNHWTIRKALWIYPRFIKYFQKDVKPPPFDESFFTYDTAINPVMLEKNCANMLKKIAGFIYLFTYLLILFKFEYKTIVKSNPNRLPYRIKNYNNMKKCHYSDNKS